MKNTKSAVDEKKGQQEELVQIRQDDPREKKRQYMRAYNKENKERLRQYCHAYHIANKEKLNKRADDYYKTNKLHHFATVDNYRYSFRNKQITSTERFLRMYFGRKNPVTSFLVERTGFCISDYFNQFDLLCLNLFGEIKPYSEIGKSIKLSFGKIYSFPDDTPLSVIFDPKNIILTKKQNNT